MRMLHRRTRFSVRAMHVVHWQFQSAAPDVPPTGGISSTLPVD
jgi:hypothetical protein